MDSHPSDHDLLAEQAAYYRARAAEYDEWFDRRGRYDHGPADNQLWFTELAAIRSALKAFLELGAARAGRPLRLLELACGTGLWTRELAAAGPSGGVASVTAVDASSEMLSVAAARLRNQPGLSPVHFEQLDLFAPEPGHATSERFDAAFIGFFLSHVPHAQWASLWDRIGAWLQPSAGIFLVDSRSAETSRARDHSAPDEVSETAVRRLNDGREFRVVKVFYSTARLAGRLEEHGWTAELATTATYFLFGTAQRDRDGGAG